MCAAGRSGAQTSDFAALPGLKADIDASKITPVADGTAVASVADISGNSHSVSQATAASQPTYRTAANGISGHPALSFNGSQYLASAGFADTTYNSGFTVYLVVQRTGGTTYDFEAGLSSATNAGLNIELPASSPASNQFLAGTTTAEVSLGFSASGITMANKTNLVNRSSDTGILAITYDPAATNSAGGTGRLTMAWNGDANEQTNGLNGTDGASGNFFTATAAPLVLGGGAGGGFLGICKIGEVLVCNQAHPVSTLKQVTQALASKWSVGLPSEVYADGDSIANGHNSTTATNGWFGLLVTNLAYPYHGINFAVDGSNVSGAASVAITRVDPFPLASTGTAFGYSLATRPHSVWILSAGTNDIGNLGAGSFADEAHNIYASIKAAVVARKTANPNLSAVVGTVIVRGPFSIGNEATRQSLNNLIRTEAAPPWDRIADFARQNSDGTAVSSAASTLQTAAFFDNQSNASNTTYFNADSIHPSDAGYTAMYPAALASVNALNTTTATTYTLTGPASGNLGAASANFTVALGGSTQVLSPTVITPHSTLAGTFTPSTITFTASTAGASGTFTFTPSAGGTASLSTTNNGSLTDPLSLSYAVTSAPSTPGSLAKSATGIVLSWAAATGATGYRIFKDGGGAPLYDGTALTYTDNLTDALAHTYQVLAYNGAGASALSGAVSGSAAAATIKRRIQ